MDDSDSEEPTYYSVIERFFLVASRSNHLPAKSDFLYFSVEKALVYNGYHDDFGPMNLSCVHKFCIIVDEFLAQYPTTNIALKSRADKRILTNSVFLVGAYLIIRHGFKLSDVESKFKNLSDQLATFRDVSPGIQNFDLHLADCWGGLWRVHSLQWFSIGGNAFDSEEYDRYSSSLNGCITEVVPGKFLALRGPKRLPDKNWKDVFDRNGSFVCRDFTPEYYVSVLQQYRVQAVVRLNAPEYDKASFREGGIAVADLAFQDCAAPPANVVGKFLALAEGLPGALAVHCKAGLGRTCTLIALYMMKHYGFKAREAIGWLRIVRPGSIIGPQQQFLCAQEPAMARAAAALRRTAAAATAPLEALAEPPLMPLGAGVATVEQFIEAACAQVDERVRAVEDRIRALQLNGQIPPPRAASLGDGTTAHAAAAAAARQRRWSVADMGLAAHVAAAVDRRASTEAQLVCCQIAAVAALS